MSEYSILAAMRVLVACSECTRQYDASKLAAGSRFRCLCGSILQVQLPEPHDAAVVRCSSCGAPRDQQRQACRFCGADFTLHERDLHTICPACMTRVSDRARFCHHCASPLLGASQAGEPSHEACPVCGEDQKLTSRQVGDPPIGVLECPRCAGLWLAKSELDLLLQRVRATAASSEAESQAAPQDYRATERVTQEGPLYRACPVCGALMHRRNFGRKSGVIVDQCGSHGYWFDHAELDSVLRWVQQGGEVRAARLEDEARREAVRQRDFGRQLEPTDNDWPPVASRAGTLIDMLSWLVTRIR